MIFRITSAALVCLGPFMTQSDASSPVDAIARSETEIPAERKTTLNRFADMISNAISKDGRADVTFICTHNSRRSQFGQAWLRSAADSVGLGKAVQTHSGGTEATACNVRTVASLRRAGFKITTEALNEKTGNPRYQVASGTTGQSITLFSKKYDDSPNPDNDFIAVMCCGDANEKCPIVSGASDRIALLYVDPKVSDDTADEETTYDERCQQIGSEMLYVAIRVKNAQR